MLHFCQFAQPWALPSAPARVLTLVGGVGDEGDGCVRRGRRRGCGWAARGTRHQGLMHGSARASQAAKHGSTAPTPLQGVPPLPPAAPARRRPQGYAAHPRVVAVGTGPNARCKPPLGTCRRSARQGRVHALRHGSSVGMVGPQGPVPPPPLLSRPALATTTTTPHMQWRCRGSGPHATRKFRATTSTPHLRTAAPYVRRRHRRHRRSSRCRRRCSAL